MKTLSFSSYSHNHLKLHASHVSHHDTFSLNKTPPCPSHQQPANTNVIWFIKLEFYHDKDPCNATQNQQKQNKTKQILIETFKEKG
jgi:hypothetical protein